MAKPINRNKTPFSSENCQKCNESMFKDEFLKGGKGDLRRAQQLADYFKAIYGVNCKVEIRLFPNFSVKAEEINPNLGGYDPFALLKKNE